MIKTWHRSILLALLPGLAACVTQPAAPVAARDVGGNVEARSGATRAVGAITVPPLAKYEMGTGGKARAPIPVRALNVTTQCEFSDEGGTHGKMALHVEDASVRRFTARVSIANQGVCNFDLARFRQTERMPTPVLTDDASSCRVYVWEQDASVTVAFNACQAYCTADAYDYLWPILVDRQSGKCA